MEHDDLVGEYLTKTAELLDTIEGKVRHIRTPAGAARYGGDQVCSRLPD